jgi:hypothetical protein
MLKTKYARARSSTRSRVARYSNRVKIHRPKIAIRASPASGRSSSASEIGPANGRAISAPAVVVQNSDANPVLTTSSGCSSAR